MNKNNIFKSVFSNLDLILALSVVVYFFVIFFKYTVNIPINDDYDVINNFNDIINQSSAVEKVKLFFLQHNEHRILYDKLWFYIVYWFNPEGLDFNILSFIGTLSLVGIVAFYFFKLKKHYSDYILLFPVSVFIINLALWENITFSMAGLSNFTFLLFAILSIHFITQENLNSKKMGFSLLFFFFSIMSQGGGVFVFPVGLMVLFLRKNKIDFLKYFISGTLIIFIYFLDYQKHPSPSLSQVFTNLFEHFKFFIAFLGSAISNYHFFPDNIDEAFLRSSILGFLFFVFYIYLLVSRYFKKNLFNFSIFTLVILISFVTAITRLNQGIHTAVSSRYRLLSVLFLVSLFIFLIEFAKRKKLNIKLVNSVVFLLSVTYLFLFNFNYQNKSLMHHRQASLSLGMLYYFSGDNSQINSLNKNLSEKVLKESKDFETFVISEEKINKYYSFADKEEFDLNFPDNSSITISSNIEKIKQLKDSYYIEGFAFLDNSSDTEDQEVYLVLYNNSSSKVFKTTPELKPGLSNYFKRKNLDNGGFRVRIKNEDIGQGTNQIGLIVVNGNQKKLIKTDKNILK